MSNTSFGISFCEGERYLKTSITNSSILGMDIDFARNLVADEIVSVDSAIERVEHAGPITTKLKDELEVCLGKIAAGNCQKYPLKEN